MKTDRPVVLIALASLAAEGTPRMALALCREWLARGVKPVILVLHKQPSDLAPQFDALGIERVGLNIANAGRFRYAVLVFKFFQLTRRFRADALLSMPLGWHTFMAVGARLAGARRVVAHVGNYPNTAPGRAFTKFRVLVQLGRLVTDRLVCCSHYVQQGAIKHFAISEKETAVVCNGAYGNDFFRPKAELSASSGGPMVLGMVARLEGHKDHVTLIHAARILRDRGENVVLKIVGDGSRREMIQNLVHSLELDDTVMLLGMRHDIQEILADLDLFVFSTTPDEGLGIALIEAMLARVPIVASDVGACREVLDGGRLGALVAPGNPAALADGIAKCFAEPLAAQARADIAQREAIAKFSAEAMAREYGKLLNLPYAEEAQADAAYPAERLA